MKNGNRFYNRADTQLKEKFLGIMDACPDTYEYLDVAQCHAMYCRQLREQVQIVISGGGCYGMLFAGFAGPALAQAVCEGDFDCAPNAYALYTVAKTVSRGKGILLIANQYTGDYLNNDMAQEFLQRDGIDSRACYVSDDIFSARGEAKENRGGLSGIAFVIKAAASAAAAGLPLDEVYRIAEKTNRRLRSATVRYNGETNNLEFGGGFSGEPPVLIEPYHSSHALAEKAVSLLLSELESAAPCRYDVLLNRTRETGYGESCVLLHDVHTVLEAAGKKVGACSSGCYFDVFDGKGCMISLVAADAELANYLTPFHRLDGAF